jgi:hypothetical protein
VINGVGERLPVGVLPAGGTSVLPRVLGLPRDLDEAVERLCDAVAEKSVCSIGLGTVNGRRFTFAAGIGIDAEIVRRIDERGRGGEVADEAERPGDLWFVREAIGVLLEGDYAEPTMEVDVPGQKTLRAATVFVANCSPWSFAGPVPLTSHQRPRSMMDSIWSSSSRSNRAQRPAGSLRFSARATTTVATACSGSTTSRRRPSGATGRFRCDHVHRPRQEGRSPRERRAAPGSPARGNYWWRRSVDRVGLGEPRHLPSF